jgi:hypothetical protein
MEVYSSGSGYKYGFTILGAAMAGLSVWVILDSKGSLFTLVGGVLMLVFFATCIFAIHRHRIILGEDFIERVYLFRRKVFFRDITQVIIENQQAFIVSGVTRLHISQEISGRSQLLQALLARLTPFQKTQISGDPFIISHLLSESGNKSGSKENLVYGGLKWATGAVSARLREKRWLYRELDVHTSRGVYTVVYYGRGMGYECVLVNGEVVDKKNSYFWYAPEFRFTIADLSAVIIVKVWPWFTLRSFTLEVGGKQVYHES